MLIKQCLTSGRSRLKLFHIDLSSYQKMQPRCGKSHGKIFAVLRKRPYPIASDENFMEEQKSYLVIGNLIGRKFALKCTFKGVLNVTGM